MRPSYVTGENLDDEKIAGVATIAGHSFCDIKPKSAPKTVEVPEVRNNIGACLLKLLWKGVETPST